MRGGLVVVALAFVTPAAAMDLPQYDIDAICAANEQAYGAPARGCIFLNQQAYDSLRNGWPTLSEWVQSHALAQCRASSPRPDYQQLAVCASAWANREDAEKERDALSSTHHFQP